MKNIFNLRIIILKKYSNIFKKIYRHKIIFAILINFELPHPRV